MARHRAPGDRRAHLCLAGGVALNCVANGRLLREGLFEDIWIQPAAGDAGGALGAALCVWHLVQKQPREADDAHDRMHGAYLGPEFPTRRSRRSWKPRAIRPASSPAETGRAEIARLIADENVIGLLQGRMEFGPRALGDRSIIGDARSPKMQSVMNLKIKYRESFRPFAPTCLVERVGDYFELDRPSPYMLLVAQVRRERCIHAEQERVEAHPRADQPGALGHPGHHARGLLGPRPDRRPAGRIRATTT